MEEDRRGNSTQPDCFSTKRGAGRILSSVTWSLIFSWPFLPALFLLVLANNGWLYYCTCRGIRFVPAPAPNTSSPLSPVSSSSFASSRSSMNRALRPSRRQDQRQEEEEGKQQQQKGELEHHQQRRQEQIDQVYRVDMNSFSLSLELGSLPIECNSEMALTIRNDARELLSMYASRECNLRNVNRTMLGVARCNGMNVIDIQSGSFMNFNHNDDDDDDTTVGVVGTLESVQACVQLTMTSNSLLAEVQQNYAWIQQISIEFSSSAPSFVPSSPPTHSPSMTPTALPTDVPSSGPSANPSPSPSLTPTMLPTKLPSLMPSVSPSLEPSVASEIASSASPTVSSFPSTSPVGLDEDVPTLSKVPTDPPSMISQTTVGTPRTNERTSSTPSMVPSPATLLSSSSRSSSRTEAPSIVFEQQELSRATFLRRDQATMGGASALAGGVIFLLFFIFLASVLFRRSAGCCCAKAGAATAAVDDDKDSAVLEMDVTFSSPDEY